MKEEILRNPENLDLFTWVIVISLLLLILAKNAFRFEYQKFLNRESNQSFNTIFVFLISSLSYLSLLALILYPLLKEQFLYYFTTPFTQFLFCLTGLILFMLMKLGIKAIWFYSFEDVEQFMENVGDKSLISFWKYVITLIFIIVFYYSPLRAYYQYHYAIILFIGLYLLDVAFEYTFIQKIELNIILYKFLYLCTLEILPVLVFLKLLFILN